VRLTIELIGLNIEKLLTLAAQEGVIIRGARRIDARTLRLHIRPDEKRAIDALCARYGWEVRVVDRGRLLDALGWCRQRPALVASFFLYVALVWLSSGMIWRISIDNAGKNIGEIRRFLRGAEIHPGVAKRAVSPARLREEMLLAMPDLVYVGAAYAGSTLVIDCQPALEEEIALTGGIGLDLIADCDALVTGLAVSSGTPVVKIGQAVRAGDVLIRGEERGEKQTTHPVVAQGTVTARVWARGDARVSLHAQRTVETGAIRQRVTLCTPWHRRVVRDAQPFAMQDASTHVEPVVGLYLPLWREIETMAEIALIPQTRSEADARSIAQAAAEQLAKKQCPAGARILDKTVEYSMIDNEFVYATVVLEYERSIAVRADGANHAQSSR